MDLRSAKILITQAHLVRFMGSEIVTLELADYFDSLGADVVVATYSFGGLLREPFERLKNVRVYELPDPELARLLESWTPDLAWIQHSIIPGPVLERADRITFFFHHMSAYLPVEYTMAPDFEVALGSVSTFVSAEARMRHVESGLYDGIEPERRQLFENPAPARFVHPDRRARSGRQRLVIVSNHVPPELVEALPQLRATFEVTIVGSQSALGARPRLVDPDLLDDADLVITIGKTVQFALAADVPVYVYDHFGGPGWLDETNFDDARAHGFSGRGFPKKSPEQLVTEIVDGRSEGRRAFRELRRTYGDAFILPRRIAELVEFVSSHPRTVVAPDPIRIRGHVSMQEGFGSYVREWIRREGDFAALQREIEVGARLLRLVDENLRFLRFVARIPGVRLVRRVMRQRRAAALVADDG